MARGLGAKQLASVEFVMRIAARLNGMAGCEDSNLRSGCLEGTGAGTGALRPIQVTAAYREKGGRRVLFWHHLFSCRRPPASRKPQKTGGLADCRSAGVLPRVWVSENKSGMIRVSKIRCPEARYPHASICIGRVQSPSPGEGLQAQRR